MFLCFRECYLIFFCCCLTLCTVALKPLLLLLPFQHYCFWHGYLIPSILINQDQELDFIFFCILLSCFLDTRCLLLVAVLCFSSGVVQRPSQTTCYFHSVQKRRESSFIVRPILNIAALLITTSGRAGRGQLILCKQKRAW